VLEIVHKCADCSSAMYGWTSVYSHLMCREIQR